MLSLYKFSSLIFISFATFAQASFLPSSFQAKVDERHKSAITGKVKTTQGTIEYRYPGELKLEKKETIYVSNPEKTWYYQAPFIPGEKGEVTIQNSNKLKLSKFFDQLKNGLVNNSLYTVTKINDKKYQLNFLTKTEKKLGVKKALLLFKTSDVSSINNLAQLKIFYADKHDAVFVFKSMVANPSFSKSHFVFKVPPNTNVTR